MRLSVVETGWFVLSVAVFAFLYGVAVGAWQWPPYAWIARATRQAEAAYRATQPTSYADRFVGPRVYDRQALFPDSAVQGSPLRSEIHGTHLRPNGDLLVSLRTPSLVFVVDPTSLEVKWTASTPFLHQHDPDFVGDGWIGVFDNNQDPTPRGTMLGGSRIVALSPSIDSMKTLFPTARSGPAGSSRSPPAAAPSGSASTRPTTTRACPSS